MPDALRITDVRLKPACANASAGLLGFISLVIDGTLRVEGIALRRTRAGETRLSWPTRVDRRGDEHTVVAPLDEQARRDLEAQVFRALHARPGGRP